MENSVILLSAIFLWLCEQSLDLGFATIASKLNLPTLTLRTSPVDILNDLRLYFLFQNDRQVKKREKQLLQKNLKNMLFFLIAVPILVLAETAQVKVLDLLKYGQYYNLDNKEVTAFIAKYRSENNFSDLTMPRELPYPLTLDLQAARDLNNMKTLLEDSYSSTAQMTVFRQQRKLDVYKDTQVEPAMGVLPWVLLSETLIVSRTRSGAVSISSTRPDLAPIVSLDDAELPTKVSYQSGYDSLNGRYYGRMATTLKEVPADEADVVNALTYSKTVAYSSLASGVRANAIIGSGNSSSIPVDASGLPDHRFYFSIYDSSQWVYYFEFIPAQNWSNGDYCGLGTVTFSNGKLPAMSCDTVYSADIVGTSSTHRPELARFKSKVYKVRSVLWYHSTNNDIIYDFKNLPVRKAAVSDITVSTLPTTKLDSEIYIGQAVDSNKLFCLLIAMIMILFMLHFVTWTHCKIDLNHVLSRQQRSMCHTYRSLAKYIQLYGNVAGSHVFLTPVKYTDFRPVGNLYGKTCRLPDRLGDKIACIETIYLKLQSQATRDRQRLEAMIGIPMIAVKNINRLLGTSLARFLSVNQEAIELRVINRFLPGIASLPEALAVGVSPSMIAAAFWHALRIDSKVAEYNNVCQKLTVIKQHYQILKLEQSAAAKQGKEIASTVKLARRACRKHSTQKSRPQPAVREPLARDQPSRRWVSGSRHPQEANHGARSRTVTTVNSFATDTAVLVTCKHVRVLNAEGPVVSLGVPVSHIRAGHPHDPG